LEKFVILIPRRSAGGGERESKRKFVLRGYLKVLKPPTLMDQTWLDASTHKCGLGTRLAVARNTVLLSFVQYSRRGGRISATEAS
jgi:hypothetical protein